MLEILKMRLYCLENLLHFAEFAQLSVNYSITYFCSSLGLFFFFSFFSYNQTVRNVLKKYKIELKRTHQALRSVNLMFWPVYDFLDGV